MQVAAALPMPLCLVALRELLGVAARRSALVPELPELAPELELMPEQVPEQALALEPELELVLEPELELELVLEPELELELEPALAPVQALALVGV